MSKMSKISMTTEETGETGETGETREIEREVTLVQHESHWFEVKGEANTAEILGMFDVHGDLNSWRVDCVHAPRKTIWIEPENFHEALGYAMEFATVFQKR